MKYFSGEIVNRGRQPEVDCLKAFTIFIMLIVHAYESCAESLDNAIYAAFHFMETMTGAAAFMLCIPVVTSFVDEQLEAIDCSMKAQIQIDIAIDELFGNIAHYAYLGGAGDATVRFDFDEAAHMASISFVDNGVPFNPLEQADPDVTLSAEERDVGGLGIFMVKKTMDKLEYSHEKGFNITIVHKHL